MKITEEVISKTKHSLSIVKQKTVMKNKNKTYITYDNMYIYYNM